MPKKRKEPETLSIEQIENRLAQMEADRKALESALKKRRSAELSAFAQEIREQITQRGYRVDEVIAVLTKGRRTASGGRRSVHYVRYVDPDNPKHSYVRGPIPGWLQEKMEAAGYDPSDKAQREEFKSTHLKRAA